MRQRKLLITLALLAITLTLCVSSIVLTAQSKNLHDLFPTNDTEITSCTDTNSLEDNCSPNLVAASDVSVGDTDSTADTTDIDPAPTHTANPDSAKTDEDGSDDPIANSDAFSYADSDTSPHTRFSDLDSHLRVGPAYAVLSKSLMPTGERGDIQNVKPTGWKQKKYDFIDNDGWLYNRCHLIGWQLCGENANWKNLMTGTRQLNVDKMLPYENRVADHLKTTNHNIRYQVTPIFEGDNALASSVRMAADCMDCDFGFDQTLANTQQGVVIDYATGASRKAA